MRAFVCDRCKQIAEGSKAIELTIKPIEMGVGSIVPRTEELCRKCLSPITDYLNGWPLVPPEQEGK